MKSCYVVFPKPGKVEVREESVSPPVSGEILCEAQKSLISIGTEMHCLRGVFDPGTNWADWVHYPFRPGYSMAARVIAAGKGVKRFKEGDRVTGWATHQRLFKAAPEGYCPVPDGVSDEDATWSSLAVTTQLAVRRAEHRLGESVGVVGLGILGQLVVQYLALQGARTIAAVDPAQGRLEMATAHGATHALAMSVQECREAVAEITRGRMLDAVYEVTGIPEALAACIPLVRKLGRVILLGDTPTPTQQRLGPGVVSNSVGILGIHGTMVPEHASEFNPWTRDEAVALFFDYLLQGRMRVSDLVTHRLTAREAPDVYQRLVHDRSPVMGAILDWSQAG
jgi:2-desacetyl-2-hydroxyethyl bacteriochlorophyllide A dehydrogenase